MYDYHESQAGLTVKSSGGNYTPLWTVWSLYHSLLSLPQMKAQLHESSISEVLFMEDAKASCVRGFIRGEDDFVLPEDKPSAF